MSYANETKRANPLGMGAAVLVNGSIILAVALSPLVVQPPKPRDPFSGRSIELTPPPQPKAEQKQQARKLPPISVPKPRNDFVDKEEPVTITNEEQETTIFLGGSQSEADLTEIGRDVIKQPMPMYRAALRDPKFARSFQPDYPVGLLQREIEGSVTVRVLIGTDGRVEQVQILRATDPEFGKATERQAMKAWRFSPATRDGTPVEDWQTLTVRFDINS